MAKIIKDKQAIDKHKAYWSKLNSEDNIDITTPELDNIYSPYSNNNPFYNGGVGTPIIQPAPAPPQNNMPIGMDAVKQLGEVASSYGAGTAMSTEIPIKVNQAEQDRVLAENAKKQSDYDTLVPQMIQSNKGSIQSYNDENQPKQSIKISPAPQTNQPQSLSDMMRPRGMEIRDSAGGFVSGTGAVRSVATPTIVSAPPPVMKDIPEDKYFNMRSSVNLPDARTGGGGGGQKRQMPTISTMNWGTGVIEQASPNDVKEFTSDFRRSGGAANNPSLAATLIERNYGGEPLPKGSTVKIPMIMYNKRTGQYENNGIQDISVEGQTMTDVISRVFNANLALNTLESLNKNKNNMADNYGQVDGSSLLKFNPHTFDQDMGGVYDTAYERAISATNDAIGLKKGTTQLGGLLLKLKNTPNTALSESYLGAKDNNMLAAYINSLAAVNGQAIYGLLRRTR